MHFSIFKIIQNALEAIGRKTGFTYNEINIIIYFFAIPFSGLCLLDVIFGGHWGKAAFVLFTLGFIAGCRNFKKYADWLFDKSVAFLNYFNRFGSNYVASSVWICVSLPIVIYAVLIFFALK